MYSLRLLTLLFLSCLWATPCSALKTSDDRYSIKLVSAGPAHEPFDARRFVYEVADKRKAKATQITVDNVTGSIERALVASGRAVFFGRLQDSADVVTVVSLDENESDYFICYYPHLSPSGRYILYTKFYPRFSDPQLTSHVLLVYDLKAPKNPRLADVGRANPGDPMGFVIYPLENARKQLVYSSIEAADERRVVLANAGYLWSQQDQQVSFMESQGEVQSLVSVSFGKGYKTPEVHRAVIEMPANDAVKHLARIRKGVEITLFSGKTLPAPLPLE